mmetsp:Transcript_29458/g.71151  ORF Transcript_29458/g.71151 Transcript_29458/m.71151 type:complete len:261 (+) Transcript_29458:748-1530(+)
MNHRVFVFVGFCPLCIVATLLQFVHLVEPISMPLPFEVILIIFGIVSRLSMFPGCTIIVHSCIFPCLSIPCRHAIKFVIFFLLRIILTTSGTIFSSSVSLSGMRTRIFHNINILLRCHFTSKELVPATRWMVQRSLKCSRAVIKIQFRQPDIHPFLEKFDSRLLDAPREFPSKYGGIGIFLTVDTFPLIIWAYAIVTWGNRNVNIIIAITPGAGSRQLDPPSTIQNPPVAFIISNHIGSNRSGGTREQRCIERDLLSIKE